MSEFRVSQPAIKVAPNIQEKVTLAYREMTQKQIEAKKIAALPIGIEFASFPIDSGKVGPKSFSPAVDALVPAGPVSPSNKTQVVNQADSFYVKLEGTNQHLLAGPFNPTFVTPI